MIRIAVCEDSQSDADILKTQILEYFQRKESKEEFSLHMFTDGRDLLECREPFDIAFLDIEMDGMNGIKTAQALHKISLHMRIVYVTNYDSYYIDAFSVHAFQYIMKPATPDKIARVLEEAIDDIRSMTAKNIILTDVDKEAIKLNINEILFFEFVERKIRVVATTREFYIKTSLKAIYPKVENNHFAIPHKAFIVNLFHIRQIKGDTILMENGMKIPVSQKRAAAFKDTYFEFLQIVYHIL